MITMVMVYLVNLILILLYIVNINRSLDLLEEIDIIKLRMYIFTRKIN